MAEPGRALPRSGSEFGADLARNQPGRAPGTAPWGGGTPIDDAGTGARDADRVRYLLPSSEAFVIDLHATPPVLAGEPERERPPPERRG